MKTAPNGAHIFDIAIYCLYCHIQVNLETINSYSYGKNGKDRSKALSRLVVYGKNQSWCHPTQLANTLECWYRWCSSHVITVTSGRVRLPQPPNLQIQCLVSALWHHATPQQKCQANRRFNMSKVWPYGWMHIEYRITVDLNCVFQHLEVARCCKMLKG